METVNEIIKLEQELIELNAQKKLRNITPTCQNCKSKITKGQIHYRCSFHNFIYCSECLENTKDVVKVDGEPQTKSRHIDCFLWIPGKRGDCIMEKKVYI